MSPYLPDIESLFSNLAQSLFSELKSAEELNLNLSSEESAFLRFNQGRLRQNTFVDQKTLSLQFQAGQRKVSFDFVLSGRLEDDQQLALELLARAREEVKVLPEDPFLVPFENKGESRRHHSGNMLSPIQVMDQIATACEGRDFAGLYAAGPVIRANQNSKGQKHWFSTESFFVDYSLFTTNVDGENKAVKGVYAGSHWDENQFQAKLLRSMDQLALMRRKSLNVQPGQHRTYLAPEAVAEICEMLGWNALSYSAFKKGNCAFAQLARGEKALSPLFSLKENFNLGLSPQFSSTGEIAPDEIQLIQNGQLTQMLASSRTAKEHGVSSNGSDSLRSPEIEPGSLKETDVLKALGTGLYLSNLHYLNWSDIFTARITGMTRYACFWVENGEIVGPIKDLRFDESLYRIFGQELEALTQEQTLNPLISTYLQREIGGKKTPGALLKHFSYTL